uniref:Leydig insulin-like peptide n=1 Tax=Macaca nemestrina TaxID=9545 RepID=A0A2K6BK38_MACNE
AGPALGLRWPRPPQRCLRSCAHPLVPRAGGASCGPRWSTGGELLQWLERRHLLHGLVTDSNPVLGPGLQPLPQTSHHHRHHRAAATNPAHYCCLSGCTQQDLLTLCPY